MKKNIKRFFSILMCLVLSIGFIPKYAISAFAAESGNESYSSGSIVSGYRNAEITLNMSKAASVSGDTVTYIADRAFHSTLSDLGNVYSVSFLMIGLYANSDISSTGCDISNHFHYDNFQLSNDMNSNTTLPISADGCLIGDLPEVGGVKECSITASLTVMSTINGYYPTDGVSKTVNIRILCVDSSDLSSMVMRFSKFRSSCWTSETWGAFSKAYNEASSVVGNANSTQSQISTAATNLTLAKENLVHNGSITQCDYCITGADGLNTTGGIVSLKGISYGPYGERNLMDIYLPENMSGDCGLILYIHGGAWVGGDKEAYTSTAYADCSKYGVVTASISYRYASSSTNGLMILDDIQASVAKAKEVASGYGLNLNKMMTYGMSAGGHLSLLYAYARRDVSPVEPVCVFDMCGPTNLTNEAYWDSALGTTVIASVLSWMSGSTVVNRQTQLYYNESLLAVSPMNYISTAVPTIICHGQKDEVVDYSEGYNLAAVLMTNNVTCDFIPFPHSNHDLGDDNNCTLYAFAKMESYVNTYLKQTVPTQTHHYVTEFVPKTCTTDGYVMYSCSDCGKYFVSDIVKASHEPGRWETVTPATYVSEGLEIRKCSVCGDTVESRTIDTIIPETPTLAPNDGYIIVVDSETFIISGVEQGTSDLYSLLTVNNGTVEMSDSIITTGTIITLRNLAGNVIAEYTASVRGDVNGDGYVDAFDVAVAGEYVNTFTEPESAAYMKAVDIFEDGYLDSTDIAFLLYISNFEE